MDSEITPDDFNAIIVMINTKPTTKTVSHFGWISRILWLCLLVARKTNAINYFIIVFAYMKMVWDSVIRRVNVYFAIKFDIWIYQKLIIVFSLSQSSSKFWPKPRSFVILFWSWYIHGGFFLTSLKCSKPPPSLSLSVYLNLSLALYILSLPLSRSHTDYRCTNSLKSNPFEYLLHFIRKIALISVL